MVHLKFSSCTIHKSHQQLHPVPWQTLNTRGKGQGQSGAFDPTHPCKKGETCPSATSAKDAGGAALRWPGNYGPGVAGGVCAGASAECCGRWPRRCCSLVSRRLLFFCRPAPAWPCVSSASAAACAPPLQHHCASLNVRDRLPKNNRTFGVGCEIGRDLPPGTRLFEPRPND